ncbi:ectonucleotide pyrophosphatase/phosphodiesterase family member 5-like protein, partial [Leptotrombidium deliense]
MEPIAVCRVMVSIFLYLLNSLNTGEESKRQLIILSFDGFRYDYINHYSTPTFDRIANEGAHAPLGYRAEFATKTFPTHWTIAT